MRNPFRDPTMRGEFDSCILMYETKHKNLFHQDGSRNTLNSIAGMFWRGFDGVSPGVWDAASKRMIGYAHWKAGVAAAEGERIIKTVGGPTHGLT